MKSENSLYSDFSNLNSVLSHSESQPLSLSSLLKSDELKRQRKLNSDYWDKDSGWNGSGARSKRNRIRNYAMKSSKGIMKKSKSMDYTNYAYNEAVGRLKLLLADSYTTPKSSSYLRNYNEDSDNYSDNITAIDRPVLSDISKYLSSNQKSRIGTLRPKNIYTTSSKENLSTSNPYQSAQGPINVDYIAAAAAAANPILTGNVAQAPTEIFHFIEKQGDYIDQLEKESKYCRNELTNLLGKVKDVIHENEQLTENVRSDLADFDSSDVINTTPSTDSDDNLFEKKQVNISRHKMKEAAQKSPRHANAPKIVYEARISELEAELMQANIDLKRLKTENEELKNKLALTDPLAVCSVSSTINCETHRKQIEHLQSERVALEDTIRHLQKSLDEAKSQQYNVSSKRYINDLMQMERSQADLEVKHLRDELDRQHERVRELQHEMARRIAEERASAERRYNNQVDQLGGDLSNQWEQVAKLQLEVERQKRYETDLKRDLSNKNSQIEELKAELRSNRSTFLADMAQVNAEKQSLEQEITSLRLQLDRAARESKTEASRLNAEIVSLRQRLDRGDADLLHSKREVLRLNDEIANLEKELAYGEMKNEIRPTKKDLDKRISEMQDKHAETVNELEQMIQNQKQLMDRLTSECRMLTNKLEDTTLKHNEEKKYLRELNESLMDRLKQIWASYKELNSIREERLRRQMLKGHYNTSETDDSCREENALSLRKPLSTISRPHSIQQNPYDRKSMTMENQHHTTTNPYLVNQQQEKISPEQLLQQLQQRHLLTPVASPHTSPPTSRVPHSTTTKAITITDSLTTMTKISRTTAKEKRNSSQSPINNSLLRTPHLNQQREDTIWEPHKTQTITPTILPTKDTNHNNMIQTCMEKATTNMLDQDKTTAKHSLTMETTQTSTTIHHNTNMTPIQHSSQQRCQTIQDCNRKQKSPKSDQLQQQGPLDLLQPTSHRRQQHQHQQQHQQQHLPYWQPTSQEQLQLQLVVQQQEKAVHNRERAEALWGQKMHLDQSSAENLLCHNSLPRVQPRSNGDVDYIEMFNLSDLEFSISSPSLMRSCPSDTDIDGSHDNESSTEMSSSPAPTAIERILPKNTSNDENSNINENLDNCNTMQTQSKLKDNGK